MLSFSLEELERYTTPLRSTTQYETKLANYRRVETSFVERRELCSGLPVQIHLESSADCNLHCPICPQGRGLIERKGYLAYETFRQLFLPQAETLANVVISGFGEPLLNPATAQMIDLASQHAVSTCMNTNGTLLETRAQALLDAQLTVINVSLDGATTSSAHRYSDKYPFESVVRGVERLRTAKDKGNYRYPILYGQFIVTQETLDEIEALKEWALGMGIEQTKFKRKHHTMPGEMRRDEAFAGHELKIAEQDQVSSTEKRNWSPLDCSHPWDSFFLSASGEIGLCSFDPHMLAKSEPLADDWADLWNGEMRVEVRRWHAGKPANVRLPCPNCNRLPGYFWAKGDRQ